MKYTILILLGIILFGFSAFFRKLSIDRMHPYQLQMVAGFVYIFLIPIWMALLSPIKTLSSSDIMLGIITTLFGIGGGLIFSFLLQGNTNVGITSALLSLSPVITLTLSYFLLQEQISIWKIIAFILAILSAILVNF